MTDEEFYTWVDGLWRDDTSRSQEEWEIIREGMRRIHEVHYEDEDLMFPPEDMTILILKYKGITQENWLQHLDEMRDDEITAMLNREPGRARLDEERKAFPNESDRTRAEFMRDF